MKIETKYTYLVLIRKIKILFFFFLSKLFSVSSFKDDDMSGYFDSILN